MVMDGRPAQNIIENRPKQLTFPFSAHIPNSLPVTTVQPLSTDPI